MVYWIVNDKEYGEEEYRELENQRKAQKEAERIARWEAEQKAREEAAQLMRQLGQSYTAYKDFMARHPQLSLRVTEGQAADQILYQELRQNLERADGVPRCGHVKADGLRCGSPRLKTGALCYAHKRMAEASALKLRLTPMEDANSVQLGLMEVTRALIDGQISERSAGLLLYSLQTAAANVDRLTFHKAPEQMVVDEPVMAAGSRKQEAFSYETLDEDLKLRLQEISDEMDRRLREKHVNARLTTEDTKEHGGGPDIERAETRLGAELRETGVGEFRARHELRGNLTTEDTKEHRGEPEIAGPILMRRGMQGLKPDLCQTLDGPTEVVP